MFSAHTTFILIKNAATKFSADDAMKSAAALAFYSALSLAPVVLFFVSIGGLISEHTERAIVSQFGSLVGPQGAETISMIVDSAQKQKDTGAISSLISISILIFSASAVFAEFQQILNRIFIADPIDHSGIRTWLTKRLFSAGMLFAVGFFMLVSLVISAGLQLVSFKTEGIFWELINTLISIGIFSLFFAAMYKYVPDVPMPWGKVWSGALLTGVLFSIGKAGIGIYLGNSAVGSAYGAAGSLIVFLVWVYYSSLVILFGAEFTQQLIVSNSQIKPNLTTNPLEVRTAY